jgi:hypothetical protein
MRAPLLGLACLLLALVAAPRASLGQTIDWLAQQAGFVVSPGPDSPRLEGMGGLTISVHDEGRELNLSDFGRNLAGLRWDSDGRRWDGWSRTSTNLLDHFDADGVRERTRQEFLEAGARVTWRTKQSSRIIGVDYSLASLDNQVERGDGNKSTGPIWGGFAGQRIGRFTLAGGVHLTTDNEDLNTSNVFAVRHEGRGVRYTASLAYQAQSLEAGIEAEHQVNTIDGISRDESRFHEDELTWKRPVRIYGGSLVTSLGPVLRGGVRARIVRIDGAEEADISWSDRMPQNPGQQNFRTITGTFEEEIRGTDLGTRWSLDPSESVQFAGELTWASLDTKVTEGSNFKGSRRALDLEQSALLATAGGSLSLMDERFRVGAEGFFRRQEDKEQLLSGLSEVTSRTVEVRVGGEYYVSEVVALRAGFLRTAIDTDIDLPRTLRVGNGITAGLGLLPRGGLVQIDAGIRIHELTPDYGGQPSFEESRTSLHLGARFLL